MTDKSDDHENARINVVGQKCRTHGNARQTNGRYVDKQDNDGQSASKETSTESSVSWGSYDWREVEVSRV